MSLSKLEEIRCPCGEVFEAELWNAVNAVEDPELKEALKCGEINVVCCPLCGQMFYAEHFILYHDSKNEIIAFVYPASFASQATQCAQQMKQNFSEALKEMLPEERVTYQPVLLFGLDSLVELIREEEEENDEVTILEYAAQDLGLSLIHLKPSLARPQQLPRILPRSAAGDLRQAVIDGIKVILNYNGNLLRFKKLLQTIEQNEQWRLDESLVVKNPQQASK